MAHLQRPSAPSSAAVGLCASCRCLGFLAAVWRSAQRNLLMAWQPRNHQHSKVQACHGSCLRSFKSSRIPGDLACKACRVCIRVPERHFAHWCPRQDNCHSQEGFKLHLKAAPHLADESARQCFGRFDVHYATAARAALALTNGKETNLLGPLGTARHFK